MQGQSVPSKSPAATPHSHHFAHSAPANIPFINRVLNRDLGCGDAARPAAQTRSLTGERPSWAGCLVCLLNKIDKQNEAVITLISQTREPEGRLPEWSQLPQVRGNWGVMEGKRICAGRFSDPDRDSMGKQTETHGIFMRIWGKWGGRRGKGRQVERSRQEGNRKERDTCGGVVSAQN